MFKLQITQEFAKLSLSWAPQNYGEVQNGFKLNQGKERTFERQARITEDITIVTNNLTWNRQCIES